MTGDTARSSALRSRTSRRRAFDALVSTHGRVPRLLAGDSFDEVAFLLGHCDATVTRVVYIHEIADARRRHMRRSRMTAEYAGALRIALRDEAG